jgi:NTE family protein
MPEVTIGLALGSGASRGWSHIGVIKALLREGIEPDIVCGTSVGAIIGGSYVSGNLEKIESWVLGSTRSDVLRFFDIGFTKTGFVDAERMNWFLRSYVAAEDQLIEDMPKKYAAVATDLDSGQEVWLTEGGLADAVRASMALPGLFPAARNDQRWLVDGGLVNPVPVTVCRALGADIVIAVNLNSGIVGKRNNGGQEPGPKEAPGLFYAIANSINIVQDRITRSRLAGDPADVLLSPPLAQIGMLEFHRAAEAIQQGEECVQRAIVEIRRLTGRLIER